ncbi:MAG: hypothetical protein IKA37_00120 [Spirochaetales bacterium]|nr:hypothetical protein [Spirochaetales bacterium]
MYFLKLNEYDLALGSTFFYLLTAFLNSNIYLKNILMLFMIYNYLDKMV